MDPGHSHGVSDSGHGHSISDPGHNHQDGGFDRLLQATGTHTVGSIDDTPGEVDLGSSRIIRRSTTGVSVRSANSGVSVRSGSTGMTARLSNSASETRPTSTAMLPCIKV